MNNIFINQITSEMHLKGLLWGKRKSSHLLRTPLRLRAASIHDTLLLLQLSRFSRVRLCATHRRQPTRLPCPGILQARTLEWVAISFSNAWKWKVKVQSLSRVRLLATPWTAAHQAPPSMGFSRQEYWSGLSLPSLPRYIGILKTCGDTALLVRKVYFTQN